MEIGKGTMMSINIGGTREQNPDARIAPSTPRANNRLTLLIAAAMLAAIVPAIAQNGPGADLQQKVAAVKQSVAENQQRLHQYQWTETTQLTLKGDAKPPSQAACQYGPDGKVQKTPLGPPPDLQAGEE